MSKRIKIGDLFIGGGSPIAVQSMLSTPSYDLPASVAQAKALEAAGCQILRIAIPDREAVRLIEAIKREIAIPLVADIHFDYRLALESAAAGVDKIRINPGNIGEDSRVRQVADCCRQRGIPIRIGVNSGSVEKGILAKYGAPTPQALVESALYHISLLERYDFDQIAVSIKASYVPTMVAAYRLMAQKCNYPLHLGVTEAGTERMGLIKNAMGIGALLLDGIGDTIRVSLTADPLREIAAAQDILTGLGIYCGKVRVVSCPTCGRTRIDLISLAQEAERLLAGVHKDITVAIMGCVVNGPGEAREADIGLAGGEGCGVLFRKGQVVRKVPEDQLLSALMEEVDRL